MAEEKPKPGASPQASPLPTQKLILSIEAPTKGKDGGAAEWMPLAQSAIWPLFGLIFVWVYRLQVRTILTLLAERFRDNAPVELPGGIKIGAGQRTEDLARRGEDTAKPPELPNTIYMTHRSVRDATLDRGASTYYRITISLDADTPALLDKVQKVIYHLHPTFQNPNRESTDRNTNFTISTKAWGEFNMTADVYLEGETKPLTIERYINM